MQHRLHLPAPVPYGNRDAFQLQVFVGTLPDAVKVLSFVHHWGTATSSQIRSQKQMNTLFRYEQQDRVLNESQSNITSTIINDSAHNKCLELSRQRSLGALREVQTGVSYLAPAS